MDLKTRIKGFVHEEARLKGFPLSMIGILLVLLVGIFPHDFTKTAGLQTFELLFNPWLLAGSAIGTLVYMKIVFSKEWQTRDKKRSRRWFHYFAFGYTGLAVTFIPFFGEVDMFFFEYINAEYFKHQLDPYLIYPAICIAIFNFIMIDIFNSYLETSIFFKIPKRNRSPMKHYGLEYKIDKFLHLTKYNF